MTSEIERITRLLEKTFDKQPWYGSSIMDVLDMDQVKAGNRMPNSHSIIELIRHMTTWRKFAIHRLLGDNTFDVSDETNFPQAGSWNEAIKELKESQYELIKAIQHFPESRLVEVVPSKTLKYTYYSLLHGIVHHDIYHLGQIALLKKN